MTNLSTIKTTLNKMSQLLSLKYDNRNVRNGCYYSSDYEEARFQEAIQEAYNKMLTTFIECVNEITEEEIYNND